MIVLVMGASGSGKSTVGWRLAERLGWRFVDADDHHPAANLEKMMAGVPLADSDREPWLLALRAELDRAREAGEDVVLAASALQRRHREILGAGLPDVLVVYLDAPRELLRRRMTQRLGHFMPVALLNSQLETLEPPGSDEHPLALDAADDVNELVAAIAERLAAEAER